VKKNRVAVLFLLTAFATGAIAQAAPATPEPELKKLDYFAGNWTSEATVHSGPWGGGGAFSDSVKLSG